MVFISALLLVLGLQLTLATSSLEYIGVQQSCCHLPKDPGPCRAKIRRYYFDSKQQKCLQFYYGGCKGNDNNFESAWACNRSCHGFPCHGAIPIKRSSYSNSWLTCSAYKKCPYGAYCHNSPVSYKPNICCPGCKTDKGVMPVGSSYQKNACQKCTCVWDIKQRKVHEVCTVVRCPKLDCHYPVKVRGKCCPVCPKVCDPNPCENGQCMEDPKSKSGFRCNCEPGYTGRLCDVDIDECASYPCQHSGKCTDGVNQFTCRCLAGFRGKLCEFDVDECDSGPCQNGGTCVDQVNSFMCVCQDGYAGESCEINVDECESNPCQNGGTCLDGIDGYMCECLDGYTGDMCEDEVNECESEPCQNGGECVDLLNGFECECRDGYVGDQCEIDVDECGSSPCDNGGTCVDQVNGFECKCMKGFAGDLCEKVVDPCWIHNPCKNGQCVNVRYEAVCKCKPGYTGRYCETPIDPCDGYKCGYYEVCKLYKGKPYCTGSCDRNGLGKCKGYQRCQLQPPYCAYPPCKQSVYCVY